MIYTLTVAEAAVYFAKSEITIRKWCQAGKLKSQKVVGYNNKQTWLVVLPVPDKKSPPEPGQNEYTALHQQWVQAHRLGKCAQSPYGKVYKQGTINNHIYGMKRYWRWAGITPCVNQLNAEGIKAVLTAKHVQVEHPELQVETFKALRHFMLYLKHIGKVAALDLYELDQHRPQPNKTPHRPKLNELELKRLTGQIKRITALYHRERLELAVAIALHTGLRAKEALSLQWGDINLEAKTVFVAEGKGDKSRTVPFDDTLIAMFKAWQMNHHIPGQSVLNNWSYHGLRISFGKAKKGININYHGLRRTYATTLLWQGVDIHVIQRLLGHSKMETTMIYVEYNDYLIQRYMQQHYANRRNVVEAPKVEAPKTVPFIKNTIRQYG
jgi:integrase